MVWFSVVWRSDVDASISSLGCVLVFMFCDGGLW